MSRSLLLSLLLLTTPLAAQDAEWRSYGATAASTKYAPFSQIDAEISATQIEYDDRVAELQQKSEGDQERIEKERDEARWMVQAVLDDTAEDSPKHKFETYKASLKVSRVRRLADWEDLAGRVHTGVSTACRDNADCLRRNRT